MRSTPERDDISMFAGAYSSLPSAERSWLVFPNPSSPWTCAAVTSCLTSGSAAPCASVGHSSKSSTPRIVSRFCVACATGTFPQTVVIASTFNSGDRIASKIANASSTPGSVSIRIRCIVCLPFCVLLILPLRNDFVQ